MNIVRHHQPGAVTVLYDQSIHQRFRGSLYFDPFIQEPTQHIPSSFNLTKTLTIILLVISLAGFTSLFLPTALAEISYRLAQTKTTPPVTPSPLAPVQAVIPSSPEPIVQTQPVSDHFTITIPKINVQSRIVANVDTSNEEKYLESLKDGVAHAYNSYLPGQAGPTILFAHSTDSIHDILQYNAKFYAVKDLVEGDEIIIQYKGKTYHYIISQQQIVDPNDLSIIRKSTDQLILVTCYPPGTDWQRLITFGRLSS